MTTLPWRVTWLFMWPVKATYLPLPTEGDTCRFIQPYRSVFSVADSGPTVTDLFYHLVHLLLLTRPTVLAAMPLTLQLTWRRLNIFTNWLLFEWRYSWNSTVIPDGGGPRRIFPYCLWPTWLTWPLPTGWPLLPALTSPDVPGLLPTMTDDTWHNPVPMTTAGIYSWGVPLLLRHSHIIPTTCWWCVAKLMIPRAEILPIAAITNCGGDFVIPAVTSNWRRLWRNYWAAMPASVFSTSDLAAGEAICLDAPAVAAVFPTTHSATCGKIDWQPILIYNASLPGDRQLPGKPSTANDIQRTCSVLIEVMLFRWYRWYIVDIPLPLLMLFSDLLLIRVCCRVVVVILLMVIDIDATVASSILFCYCWLCLFSIDDIYSVLLYYLLIYCVDSVIRILFCYYWWYITLMAILWLWHG